MTNKLNVKLHPPTARSVCASLDLIIYEKLCLLILLWFLRRKKNGPSFLFYAQFISLVCVRKTRLAVKTFPIE